ncbi:hypothetical protein GCM10010371_20530 [Streptomyces subrutilus]|uniref:Uncharacterized protein n=1 Tax=Streptomyces subrutilus TaxID=36818 RepID=A0A918QPA2_9ACTN|nr:hypothetical protein [Streptomyces subrutilus]GGZ60871.1 hypothetical protein GCM10010371_20530 [Streptomyces subrutilus]
MEHVVDDDVELLQLTERGVEHFFQEFLDDTLVVTRLRLQVRKGTLLLFRHQPSQLGHGRDEHGGGRVTVDGGEFVGFERSRVLVRLVLVIRHVVVIGCQGRPAECVAEPEALVHVIQKSPQCFAVRLPLEDCQCSGGHVVREVIDHLISSGEGDRSLVRTVLRRDDLGIGHRGLRRRRGRETLGAGICAEQLPHRRGFPGTCRTQQEDMGVSISQGRQRQKFFAQSSEVCAGGFESVVEDIDDPLVVQRDCFRPGLRLPQSFVLKDLIQLFDEDVSLLVDARSQSSSDTPPLFTGRRIKSTRVPEDN